MDSVTQVDIAGPLNPADLKLHGLAAEAQPYAIGEVVVDRYEVVRLRSSNVLICEFVCHDRELDEEISLRALRPDLQLTSRERDEFIKKMLRLRGVHHPSMVRVHDVSQDRGHAFWVTPLSHGMSLQHLIKQRRRRGETIAWEELRTLTQPILSLLQHTASVGVFGGVCAPHLVVSAETVKLDGLGVWQALPWPKCLTWLKAEPSWWRYQAPEQRAGLPPTAKGDVYSLGLLLLEAMTDEWGDAAVVAFTRQSGGCSSDVKNALLQAGQVVERLRLADVGSLVRLLDDNRTVSNGVTEQLDVFDVEILNDDVTQRVSIDVITDLANHSESFSRSGEVLIPEQILRVDQEVTRRIDITARTAAYVAAEVLVEDAVPMPMNKSITTSEKTVAVSHPLPLDRSIVSWRMAAVVGVAVLMGVFVVSAIVNQAQKRDAESDLVRKRLLLQSPQTNVNLAGLGGRVADTQRSVKCPDSMAMLRRPSSVICMDKYEAPGSGKIASRNISWMRAKSACEARGQRLCTAKEWRAACGKGRYPYGDTYQVSYCNTATGTAMASGVQPKCVTPEGIYDLSGNVAEWVSEGFLMGGDARSSTRGARCTSRLSTSELTGYRCCIDVKGEF